MRLIEKVDVKRFDAFAMVHPLNHYSKTTPFISFKYPEFYQGDLLGVENDQGDLIATALMLHQKVPFLFGSQFSYIQYGFNLDIENRELLSFFLKELREYARKKGSFFLRIDPNITRLEHEKDGTVKEGGFNHEYVTDLFLESGYHHLGYNYGYSGNWMSRYTYRLDLNQPFQSITKGIKRYNQYTSKNDLRHVLVHKAGKEELSVLCMGQEELSKERGFQSYGLAYFEKLWDCFEPYIHYYVVTTNYHVAKRNLQKAIQEEKKKILLLKDEKKIATIQKSIESMEKEISEIEKHGLDVDQTVPLGAKLIIKQDENVWNVNMYTHKSLLNFRAAFALHCAAIEDLYHQGAKTYDFEGISGSLNPSDPYYGQQDFKKSFGGDFLEFLGEFDAILMPKKYVVWKKTDQLYRRIRRKFRYLMNKK